MNIHPTVAEFFHANGRTDRHIAKLVVAFGNFANARRKCRCSPKGKKNWEIKKKITRGWIVRHGFYMEFGRVHNPTYFPVTTVHTESGQETPLRILMLVIF